MKDYNKVVLQEEVNIDADKLCDQLRGQGCFKCRGGSDSVDTLEYKAASVIRCLLHERDIINNKLIFADSAPCSIQGKISERVGNLLHSLRNTYGCDEVTKGKMMRDAADEIEQWQEAYENLLNWAKQNGLDCTARNH